MINIYDADDNFIAKADSVVSAGRITTEYRKTITNKINRPQENDKYAYYTDDNRGYLLRLCNILHKAAIATEYPTPAQIEMVAKVIRDFYK